MTGRRFDHAALIVDSDDTLRRRLLPVLRTHLAAGEPVLLVVGTHTEKVIRASLEERARGLEWGDPGAFYQRLGFAFQGFRRYLAEQHAAGRSVHVIAEPDVRTDLAAPVDRVAAYLTYESMCNEAYAGFGCPVTCVWDSRRHPTLVIEGVRSLHDHELTDAGREANPTFVTTTEYLAGRAQVAMPPAPALVEVDLHLLDRGGLAGMRASVQAWCRKEGFTDQAGADVLIAASEIAGNGLTHGSPPVRVRGWRYADTLVVQVDDHGGRPVPPAAGYRRPDEPATSGYGLWLARQLADVLTTHTGEGVTRVRMYFPRSVMT
ncbi:MAG TPA: MEDS domain-containing protein [Rugosimonospora sp.]|nr:MEDS domain-containing protein [Rugosimonospora sp.]